MLTDGALGATSCCRLYGHLDGTLGGACLILALCTGKLRRRSSASADNTEARPVSPKRKSCPYWRDKSAGNRWPETRFAVTTRASESKLPLSRVKRAGNYGDPLGIPPDYVRPFMGLTSR
jgi:hypothetical protein